MSKIDKLEKDMQKIDKEVEEYIHEIADIKVPTDKEFYKHKKKVLAKVISSNVYLGFTNSEDIVYDVLFEYTIKNVIYKSRMQTKNKYNEGEFVNLYYYKKNPEFTREISKSEEEPYLLEIILFILILIFASIFILRIL